MKRTKERDISSFFSKKIHKDASSPNPPSCTDLSIYTLHQKSGDSISNNQDDGIEVGAHSNPLIQARVEKGRLSESDVINLPQDPGKRRKMVDFRPDDRDIVRKEYIRRKPYQPEMHDFPRRPFGNKMRRFSSKWFGKYKPWLEYSVEKDAAFCLVCYLFKKHSSVGGDAFVNKGFKNWYRVDAFDKHVGGHTSAHNKALGDLNEFRNKKDSISRYCASNDKSIKDRNDE